MAKKQNETQIEVFESVDVALNAGEAFIEKNQKSILIGLGVVVLAIIGIIFFKVEYLEPRDLQSKESLFGAEQFFARDSFELALNGNGSVSGFLDVIDEYGGTDAGNLAKAYAGLCYKNLGDYENAIKYLNKFSSDDKMIQPAILGAIGDCYWDLGDATKAISYYKKAAKDENDVMTPYYNKRAAVAYISLGENDKAIKLLDNIEKNYPNFSDLSEIKKLRAYIEQ